MITTIKTKNSTYVIDGNVLWKNGVMYTDDIRFIGGMTKGCYNAYNGTPQVGDMLYIEYYNGATMRSIRTSTITEVSA